MDFPDDEFEEMWVHSDEDDYDYDSETDYDSPSDFDYEFDEDDHIQEHEMFLYDYSPDSKEVENLTGLDVLKVSDMTMKLVDALKLRLGLDSEEVTR